MNYLNQTPFKGIKLFKEPPGQMRILSPEEEELFLANALQPLYDIAVLMLNTGMRPEEVYSIRGENVNLQEGFIFVPEGKTRAARRTLPLNEEALEVLRRRKRDGYLFPQRKDSQKHMTACRGHRKVCRKLKLEFRLYDLRHTFGSRMGMAGVDLPTLRELMGHTTIQMTMRDVHPTPEHKVEAIRKLTSHKKAHNVKMAVGK